MSRSTHLGLVIESTDHICPLDERLELRPAQQAVGGVVSEAELMNSFSQLGHYVYLFVRLSCSYTVRVIDGTETQSFISVTVCVLVFKEHFHQYNTK